MYRRFAPISPPSKTVSSLSGGPPQGPALLHGRADPRAGSGFNARSQHTIFRLPFRRILSSAPSKRSSIAGWIAATAVEIELFGAIVQRTHIFRQTGPPNGRAGFKYWGEMLSLASAVNRSELLYKTKNDKQLSIQRTPSIAALMASMFAPTSLLSEALRL
jgi:hypothetical protein